MLSRSTTFWSTESGLAWSSSSIYRELGSTFPFMIQIYISLRLSLEKYLRPILLVGGPSTPRSAAEYYPEDVVLRHPHYAQPVNPPNPDLRSGSTRSASQSQGSSSSSVESLASSSSREVSSSFEATFPQDLQVWSDFFKFQISYFLDLTFVIWDACSVLSNSTCFTVKNIIPLT